MGRSRQNEPSLGSGLLQGVGAGVAGWLGGADDVDSVDYEQDEEDLSEGCDGDDVDNDWGSRGTPRKATPQSARQEILRGVAEEAAAVAPCSVAPLARTRSADCPLQRGMRDC